MVHEKLMKFVDIECNTDKRVSRFHQFEVDKTVGHSNGQTENLSVKLKVLPRNAHNVSLLGS